MSDPRGVDLIISRTQDYLSSREDSDANIVLRHLQEFSGYEGARLFDQCKDDVPRLSLCLYELVSSLDHESSVLWAAVEALQRICQMSLSCGNVGEVYKFIPPLAGLLHADLSQEKRICLLHLLKSLTRDMQSSHKEVPLKCLTSRLIELVTSEEMETVHLSLEILVNLCQKNQSLVYSLKSSIGSRFLQALMNLRTGSLNTKVLMCKLLFILEPIALSVDGPTDIARTIMDVTFSNLMESFEENRLSVLSDVVGFFEKLVQFPIYKEILCSYDKWEERASEVLSMLEVSGRGMEERGVVCNAVMRLVTALVQVDLQSLWRMLPAITDAALKAAFRGQHSPQLREEGEDRGNDMCIPSALRLLCLILHHLRIPDHTRENSYPVMDLLLQHLPDLVSLLSKMDPLGTADSFICLLDLIEEMIQFEQLVPDLLNAVEIDLIASAFTSAAKELDDDDVGEATSARGSTRRLQMVLVCARAMSLLSAMSQAATTRTARGGRRARSHSSAAETAAAARDKLWSLPSGQRALAVGFYEGDADTKSAVLRVAAQEGLPSDSAVTFAKSLAAYQQSVIEPLQTDGQSSSLDLKNASAMSQASGGLIDSFLEEFRQKLETEEGVPVSMAMSLYEYKLAAQSRIQQALGANLSLAQSSCFGLQHQINVLDRVIKRQRETLLERQRLNEGLFLEVGMFKDSLLHEKETRKLNMRKHEEDLSRKEKLLALRKQENFQSQKNLKIVSELKLKLEADLSDSRKLLKATSEEASVLSSRIGDLELELKTSEKQFKGKMMKLSALKDRVRESEQVLVARDTEVKNLKKVRGSLETEATDLNKVKEVQMKNTSERDTVLQKLKQELSDLKRMRDMITSIAGGGKVE